MTQNSYLGSPLTDDDSDMIGESQLTDEQRKRLYDYGAKPYIDEATKRHEALDLAMQAQGMRFWQGREDEHYKQLQETDRLLAENVEVPMIQWEKQYGLQAKEQAEASQARGAQISGTYLGAPTLAATAQQQQYGLASRAQTTAEMEQASQAAARSAGLTGKLYGETTLAAQEIASKLSIADRQMTLQELIEKGQLSVQEKAQLTAATEQAEASGIRAQGMTLAELVEANRQMEERARLTGVYQGTTVSLETMQITPDDLSTFPGTFAGIERIQRLWKQQTGGLPTDEEVLDLLSGKQVTLPAAQTLAYQAQALQEKQYELEKELQTTTLELEKAKATGDYDGRQTLEAKALDLQAEIERGKVALEKAAFTGTLEGQQTLQAQAQTATFTGIYEGQQTLQALAQTASFTGDYNGQKTLEALAQDFNKKVEEAKLTGDYEGQRTLEALAQDFGEKVEAAKLTGTYEGQQTLQALAQDFQQKIQEAEVTGTYEGQQTLQAQSQAFQQKIQEASVTGVYPRQLSARDLGVSLGGLTDDNGDLNFQAVFKATEQLQQQFRASMGRDATAEEIGALLQGLPVNLGSNPTLAAVAQRAEATGYYGDEQTLARLAQDIDEKIRAAQLTGDYKGQQTLQSLAQDLEKAVQEAQLTGDYTGVKTLQAQAQEEVARVNRAELTGVYGSTAMSLDALGLGSGTNADGSMNATKVIQATEAIRAAFLEQVGRSPYSSEVADILSGKIVMAGQDTLAKTLQGTQTALEQAKLTGDLEGVATLQGRAMDLKETMDKRAADLAEAEVMGTMGSASFSRELLGIPADVDLATSSEMDIRAAEGAINESFQDRFGRNATSEEFNAIMRGQSITVAGQKTLAQLQYELTKQTKEAELTGKWDGVTTIQETQRLFENELQEAVITGTYKDAATIQEVQRLFENKLAEADRTGSLEVMVGDKLVKVETLEQQKLKFEKDMETRKQQFTERMETAAQTGYVVVGENGTITPQDLGVDATYLKDVSLAKLFDSPEVAAMRATYEYMSGGDTLTDAQVISLVQGGELKVDKVLRVETTAARAQREQNELDVAGLTGTIYGKKTEAARQFDEAMTNTTNMTTAQITQISAQVALADKELEQRILEFGATNQLALAELTGYFGGKGTPITAADLGINVDRYEDLRFSPEGTSMVETIKQTFKTAYGRDATTAEIWSLVQGESINPGMSATLAAKQLTAQISSDNLNRAADAAKFATISGLDQDKFDQAVIESDRNYALSAQEIADRYQLDQQQFSLARKELDAALTGKIGLSGSLTLADLGMRMIPADVTPAEQKAYETALKAQSETLLGRELTGSEFAQLMRGGTITVPASENYTQAAKEAALAHGLDVAGFTEAASEFDTKMAASDRDAFLNAFGYYEDDPMKYSLDYKKFEEAKDQYDDTNEEREQIWINALQKAVKPDPDGRQLNLAALGVVPENRIYDLNQLTGEGYTADDFTRTASSMYPDTFYDSQIGRDLRERFTQIYGKDISPDRLKRLAQSGTIYDMDDIIKNDQIVNRQLYDEYATKISAAVNKLYGYAPTALQVRDIMSGYSPLAMVPAFTNDDFAVLTALVNGHAYSVTPSDNSWAQGLGQGLGFLGAVLAG